MTGKFVVKSASGIETSFRLQAGKRKSVQLAKTAWNVLKRTLATLLVASWASVIGAQAPVDVMLDDLTELKRHIAELEREQGAAAEFRRSQAAALAELLSRQFGQNLPTKESATAWVSGADQARAELKAAANNPSFLASAPPEVRTLAKDCILAAASAQVSENSQFSLAGCSSEQQQKLKEELRKLEFDAQRAYERCRGVVTDLAPEYAALVPTNAHDADVTLLASLATYPNAAVRECKESLEEAHQQLKDIKDSKALLSNAMMMAANICVASGGNPYVCGAMLAIAVLMEIFDGSGGGGNGEGEGEGPAEGGAGGQDVPTISGGPAPETGADKTEREDTAKQAIKSGPSANLGESTGLAGASGNLDSTDAKTNISCDAGARRIVCFIRDRENSERTFSGHDVITRLSFAPEPGAVTTCLNKVNGTLQIAGIAVKDGAVHHSFAYNSVKTVYLNTYDSSAAACKQIK